jgi:hypothetical protein
MSFIVMQFSLLCVVRLRFDPLLEAFPLLTLLGGEFTFHVKEEGGKNEKQKANAEFACSALFFFSPRRSRD